MAVQSDLPIHCSSVNPLMDPLIKQVEDFKEQASRLPIGIDNYFVDDKEFEDELNILESRFCAVFQACMHAEVKVKSTEKANETEWRSDHDRLMFDFFLCPLNHKVDNSCSVRAW